jgi:Rod binding domain-containing protein
MGVQLTNASGDMGLDPYKTMGHLSGMSREEQLKQVAGQFEKIFIKQFLHESLSSSGGGILGGDMPGGDIYKSMMEDTLADGIESGGGMGLSNVLQAQLQQLGSKGVAKDAVNNA